MYDEHQYLCREYEAERRANADAAKLERRGSDIALSHLLGHEVIGHQAKPVGDGIMDLYWFAGHHAKFTTYPGWTVDFVLGEKGPETLVGIPRGQ